MNPIRKLGFALILLTMTSSVTSAISRSPAGSDVVRVKYFDVGEGEDQDRVFVIVRKDGDIASHKYVVEVRPTCRGKTTNWRELPVVPVTAACHIDASTVHHDKASNVIRFEIFRSDGAACKKEFESISFPLSHLCDFE